MLSTLPVAGPSGQQQQHGVVPYETIPQLLTLIANMQESAEEMHRATLVIGQLIERVDYASPQFPGGGGAGGGVADQSRNASSLFSGYSRLTPISQLGASPPPPFSPDSSPPSPGGGAIMRRPRTPCENDASYYSGLGRLFGTHQSGIGSPGGQQQAPGTPPSAAGGLSFLDDPNFAAQHQQGLVGTPQSAGGNSFHDQSRSLGSPSVSSPGSIQSSPGSLQSPGGSSFSAQSQSGGAPSVSSPGSGVQPPPNSPASLDRSLPGGGQGQQQQQRDAPRWSPASPVSPTGLSFLQHQSFLDRNQQSIDEGLRDRILTPPGRAAPPPAAGSPEQNPNATFSVHSGSPSSSPPGVPGSPGCNPNGTFSVASGSPPPGLPGSPGQNSTFSVPPASPPLSRSTPPGMPGSPGYSPNATFNVPSASPPSSPPGLPPSPPSPYSTPPGSPSPSAAMASFNFQDMRVRCPDCGNQCSLKIRFQYNGVARDRLAEQEILYFISMSEAGRPANAPSGDQGQFCPEIAPFEYQADFYQSFDRMALECPLCHRALNLKTAFSYLGPNYENPFEVDVKLRLKVTNEDLHRDAPQ